MKSIKYYVAISFFILLSGCLYGQNNEEIIERRKVNSLEYILKYNSKYKTVEIYKSMLEGTAYYTIDFENFGYVRYLRDIRPDIRKTLTAEQQKYLVEQKGIIYTRKRIDTNNKTLGTFIKVMENTFDPTGKDKRKLSVEDLVRIESLVEKEKTSVSLKEPTPPYGYVNIHFNVLFGR